MLTETKKDGNMQMERMLLLGLDRCKDTKRRKSILELLVKMIQNANEQRQQSS